MVWATGGGACCRKEAGFATQAYCHPGRGGAYRSWGRGLLLGGAGLTRGVVLLVVGGACTHLGVGLIAAVGQGEELGGAGTAWRWGHRGGTTPPPQGTDSGDVSGFGGTLGSGPPHFSRDTGHGGRTQVALVALSTRIPIP